MAEPVPFPLRPDRQGLVIVDMQNDFVREGAPQEVPDARAMVEVIRRLLRGFREARLPVFFTRFITGPERTLMWAFSPECADEVRSCRPGHRRRYLDRTHELEGAAIIDELIPLPEDVIIDKFGYSAFHNSHLADSLHAHRVEQVVVAGTVTQICVEDTVRGGFHHNFEMVVAEDAVASFDPELHAATLRGLAMKYARVLTSDAILEALGTGAVVGRTR